MKIRHPGFRHHTSTEPSAIDGRKLRRSLQELLPAVGPRVGPSAQVLELTGNKASAIAAAKAAGLPVLASTPPSSDIDELLIAAESMTFPVFVKAVAGGGRGMRRVEQFSELREAIEAAAREAQSAFGDATVFLEKAVLDPRHIEVQILADHHGTVLHLFDRDCPLQRRHQKVIELAPAPNISEGLRTRLCADAVAFARQIGYTCAGTAEFLVDRDENNVFIEMKPRIQVENTPSPKKSPASTWSKPSCASPQEKRSSTSSPARWLALAAST